MIGPNLTLLLFVRHPHKRSFEGSDPRDLAKAREFCTGFLGLSEDWEHRFGPDFPAYLQVSRAGLILHLTEHHGDASPGGNAFVWMQCLDAFHAEITGRGYAYAKPGIDTWNLGSDDMGEARAGMRVMEVTDPFGNRLRFAEPLPAADATRQPLRLRPIGGLVARRPDPQLHSGSRTAIARGGHRGMKVIARRATPRHLQEAVSRIDKTWQLDP